MNVLILGASSGLGRALSFRFAEAGHRLVLVARDAEDLAATAQDVALRFGVGAIAQTADVTEPQWIDAVAHAVARHGPLDVLAMPIGAVADDDTPALDAREVERLLRVNFLAAAQCSQRFWPEIAERKGVIVGFGSVAAARGRTRNAAYAAAKSALESWFESLRHFGAGTGPCVQIYQLGYLDTSPAYGLGLRLPKGDPDALARMVVRDLGKDFGVRHFPFFWRYVALALRLTPWSVYKHLRH